MTDITGFGLVGHLNEMLAKSDFGAKIYLNQLPTYGGAILLSKRGIQSTLKPDNEMTKHSFSQGMTDNPKYSLCFDPQTAGGMLSTLDAPKAPLCIERLREAGYKSSTIIGEISDRVKDILISA